MSQVVAGHESGERRPSGSSVGAEEANRHALLGWRTDWSAPFVNDWGTRLVVGPGKRTQVVFEMASMGSYRPLLICSERFTNSDEMAAIERAALPGTLAIFSGMSRDGHKPTDADVDLVAAAARAHGADGIVGLGGGFIMDLAKVSLAALSPDLGEADWRAREDVRPVAEGPGVHERSGNFRRTLPLLVVPTTSGPGTETSSRSAIRNAITNARVVVAGPQFIPRVAILDPELTVGLSYEHTVGTGINAFAHCVESLYSSSGNPLAARMAVSAAQIIFEHLPRVARHPEDLAARSAMQVGSAMAGMALSNAYVGIHHSLCHPLGLELRVPHGIANFIMLRHALRFNLDAAGDVLAMIGVALGVTPASGPSARATLAALETWQDQFTLPVRLRDTGLVSPDDFGMLAAHAFVDAPTRFNPRKVESPAEIEEIYRQAW